MKHSILVALLLLSVFPLFGKNLTPADHHPARTTTECSGVIRAVHSLTPRMIDLERTDGIKLRFQLTDTCKISTANNPDAALKDLKLGDKVNIRYQHNGEDWLATSVSVSK